VTQRPRRQHPVHRISAQAGVGNGLGGRVVFRGASIAGPSVSIFNHGGDTALSGAEARISFHDDSRLTGSAVNAAGTVAGASGARLEFYERASHDSSEHNPALGVVVIFNAGSTVAGAVGGATVFHDGSVVRGTQSFFFNATNVEGAPHGSIGGTTTFLDRSRAGSATIDNAGGTAGSGGGGWTYFRDRSSADSASIVSHGTALVDGVTQGTVQFTDDSTAATARLQNLGGPVSGASGGLAQFRDRATAGSAGIVNGGGEVAGAVGGGVQFFEAATARSASILNEAGEVADARGGRWSSETPPMRAAPSSATSRRAPPAAMAV